MCFFNIDNTCRHNNLLLQIKILYSIIIEMWSQHATIIMFIYILVAIILSGGLLVSKGRQTLAPAITGGIILVLFGLFLAYYSNCIVLNNCLAWDRVRTLLFCLPAFIVCIIFILLYMPANTKSIQPTQPVQPTQPRS
jgi:ABC-type Fe3+ transport system permease subunit